MLEDICKEPWRRQRLLGALFPERFVPEPPPVQVDSNTFFNRLIGMVGRCRRYADEVIAAYERKAWPEWLRKNGGILVGLREEIGTITGSHCLFWVLAEALVAHRTLNTADSSNWPTCGKGGGMSSKTPRIRVPGCEMLKDLAGRRVVQASPIRRGCHCFRRFISLVDIGRSMFGCSRRSKNVRRKCTTSLACLMPRVDEALTGAGVQFDAPPAPLHMGLHWVLRELVRLEVVDGQHLYADCWVPSQQVLRFLRNFGLDDPDDGMPNREKARAIFDFLESELETAMPHLHRAFDIPIRHVASDPDLGRQLGLEQ